MKPGRSRMEAVLAEYGSVRSEIQQVNRQIFAALSSSLALNVAVLGWLVGKDTPSQFYALPTVGMFLLLGGNAILLNQNRVAHRLALFQKYFIEPRLPDLCWGRVYFAYRERYPRSEILSNLGERLAESGTFILLLASCVNLLVLVVLGLIPCFKMGSMTIDWMQMGNLALALGLIGLQEWFRRILTDCSSVESTMRDLAMKSGLTTGCS